MKILKYIIFSLILTLSLSGGEVIETLPTRERAEMNIEVTKVFSEKLDASLDEINKEITLNFKEVPVDESQFEIFFIENLKSLPSYSVSKGGRKALEVIKNGAKLRAGSKITTGKLSYFLDRARGERALKIQYEEKPEKLYLGVLNKSTNMVAKVFSINYDTPTTYAYSAPKIESTYDKTDKYLIDNEDLEESPNEGYYLFEIGYVKSVMTNYVAGNGGTNIDIIPGVTIGDFNQQVQSSATSKEFSANNFVAPKIRVGEKEVNIRSHFYSGNLTQSPLTHSFVWRFKNDNKGVAYNVNRTGSSTTLTLQTYPRISLSPEVVTAFRDINNSTSLFEYTSDTKPYFNFVTSKRDRNKATIDIISDINVFSSKFSYPKLGIKKDYIEYDGTIEFKNYKNSAFVLNGNSLDNESVSVKDFKSTEETNISNTSKDKFLRGLLFNSTVNVVSKSGYSISNFTEGVIGGDGIKNGGTSTVPLQFQINNGDKWAKVKISYNNGIPTFELLDYYPKSSNIKNTFEFFIEHKENSGLVRRKYNVKLLTPDTNKLTVNHSIPESVTYNDVDRTTEKYDNPFYVFSGGYITATLSNYIENSFPAITVGKTSVDRKWKYFEHSTFNDLNLINTEHNLKFKTRVHLSFENLTSLNIFHTEYATKYDNGTSIKRAIIVGYHQNRESSDSLTTKAELRLNLPDFDIVSFRKNIQEYIIPLTPENTDFNLVTSNIGEKNAEATAFTVNSDSEPKITIPYPSIKFIKDNVIQSGEVKLNTNYQKGMIIDFNNAGVATSNTTTLENISKFPQGLSFGGTMEVYQGETKIGETMNVNGLDKYTGAGDTSKHQFTLKDYLGRDAKISLQYRTDGLVSFSLDEWEGEGEINFTIVHKEGSGLTRKTTNMKIVTPKIGEEKSKGILDFGVLLKGSNIDYTAETSIVVQPFSGHNLILELESPNISLTNGNSTVEATGLSIDSGKVDGANKVFTLKGVITKGNLDKSIAEGAHTGTIRLQMRVAPATTVNLNNK